jgi:outer membrane protein TolC
VDWELSPWQPPGDVGLAPESAWVDAALANRPEIQSKIWELRALGEELKGASLPPLQGGEIGAHGEHDPEWRLGPVAAIPLPVFDFGQATRQKVKAERIAARHDLAQMQLEVIQNVRSTYAAYLHTRRALADAQNKLLPLQQQQLQSAQLAYESGDVEFAILLLAQNEYELTLSKIVELEEKVTVARAKLMRATGGAGVAEHLTSAQTQPAQGAPAPATLPARLPSPEEPSTSQPATGPVR